ncbi:MAG: TlpA disulfide reductase family protein [Pseudomonadota bacterium]
MIAVAVLAAALGYGYNVWRTAPEPPAAATSGLSALMASCLPDLEQRAQSIAQWQGKVIVVNFWATWCAPCREEIPLFVKLQTKYGNRGLQFVGIAIDNLTQVKPYAAELGMNFPVLIGGVDAIELARQLGNKAGVLPFTVILNREGKIVATEVGAMKEAKLEPLLASLL